MATLQASDIADLVLTTLDDLGRFKWTDATSDLQRFSAFKQILRKQRFKQDSGKAITWNVQYKHLDGASWVGLHQQDQVDIGDTMVTATAPWRHITNNYAFDEREVMMNSGAARIVDLVATRRHQAMVAYAEKFENALWTLLGSTDTKTMYGLPYWVVVPASGDEGFVDDNPSGFSSTGGIDATDDTYKRWRSYGADYAAVTKADLIDKMRTGARKTDFMAVIPHPSYKMKEDCIYYTNNSVLNSLTTLGEAQNENLGRDLDRFGRNLLFQGCPFEYVSLLDDESTNPIYGINWAHMQFRVLENEWLKETRVENVPGQHRDVAIHIDSSCNLICTDRRRQQRFEVIA